MKIDILCGGQFGSEAKGLVASEIVRSKKYDWLISVNSAQAGHTSPFFNKKTQQIGYLVTRQLPASCITDLEAGIYIGAGAVINLDVLNQEIENLESNGIPVRDRLHIDENATVIDQFDIFEENRKTLNSRIGSTGEGVGSALARRCMRESQIYRDFSNYKGRPKLKGNIFLEGSQGFGLSPFYKYYPFCTSRDTTASAFLSYAQLSPLDVGDIYGVFRTYPIRVGGNSGFMHDELDWDIIALRSGYEKLEEYTTVTKRLRRIGEWDTILAQDAMKVNGITKPCLTFLNYINCGDEGVTEYTILSQQSKDFIMMSGKDIGKQWSLVSTSKEGGWIYL